MYSDQDQQQDPMPNMTLPQGKSMDQSETKSPFQSVPTWQKVPNPYNQNDMQSFATGGKIARRKMNYAHMSKEEANVLDKLQGKSTRHRKTKQRAYPGLEAILKNPHLYKLIMKHAKEHKEDGYAEGGHVEKLKKNGRYGDTEIVMIGPRTNRLLDALAGHKTRNPKDGLPEYFSLGKMFSGLGKTLGRGAKHVLDPFGIGKKVLKGGKKSLSAIGNIASNLPPEMRAIAGAGIGEYFGLPPEAGAMLGEIAPSLSKGKIPVKKLLNAGLKAAGVDSEYGDFINQGKEAFNQYKDQAQSYKKQGKDLFNQYKQQAQDYGQGLYNQGRDMYDQGRQQVMDYGQDLYNQGQDMYNQGRSQAQDAYQQAQDYGQDLYNQGMDYGQNIYNQGQNMANQYQQQAQDYGQGLYNQGQNYMNQAQGYGQNMYNQGQQQAQGAMNQYNQTRQQFNDTLGALKQSYQQPNQGYQQPMNPYGGQNNQGYGGMPFSYPYSYFG
jgi:hypothetical protein